MDLDEWAGSKVTSEFFQIDPKELAPPQKKLRHESCMTIKISMFFWKHLTPNQI